VEAIGPISYHSWPFPALKCMMTLLLDRSIDTLPIGFAGLEATAKELMAYVLLHKSFTVPFFDFPSKYVRPQDRTL
jgi:hypothetical protein